MSAEEPKVEAYVATVRPMPGEPTRFQVRSKSRPDEYHLVDIAEFNGSGRCSCIRWDTVCWPLIKTTGSLPPSKRCRHIRAAREMACTIAIRQHLKEHPELQWKGPPKGVAYADAQREAEAHM